MLWKELLKNNVTTVKELKTYVPLSSEEEVKLEQLIEQYPMSIPKYYLSLINPKDSKDPIKKMAIPSVTEFNLEGMTDTSGEEENTKLQGLQHKYAPTVLLLSTNTCAMYCRHCFRKRLVGLSQKETLHMFDYALDYIQSHTSVNNVLITGGDSFLLDTSILEGFLDKLSQIDHLDFIRFGTRIPVVMPQRIYKDSNLLAVLEQYNKRKQIYLVTQFNHVNELTKEALQAIKALQQRGIVISNQAVLMKDVNDTPADLTRLINRLTQLGVLPYYIFQCRPVRGVANSFQVPIKKGHQIIEQAKNQLNGHGKRFRYIMSHRTGKIEILGPLNSKEMLFKYHQAKSPDDYGKIFTYPVSDERWLFDL